MKIEKIEEFNCCHSFVQDCVSFILPFDERKFICITHLVGIKFHISSPTTTKILGKKSIALLLIFYMNLIIRCLNIGM